MQGLHLIGGQHLWILQVHEEVLDLIGQESIGFYAPFLFLLLLDLQAADLISDRLLQRADLLGYPLIEDHNVLKQVHFHLVSLTV